MGSLHTLEMPRKVRSNPKPQRQPTQMRAWRKHRGLSLEKLAERLMVEEEYDVSPGQLSRIETGKSPYTQDLWEAIARVLRTSPPDLINVDPGRGQDAMWSIYESLSGTQKAQAVQMLKVLKGTGTEG